jgi:Helicase HerA, central domain
MVLQGQQPWQVLSALAAWQLTQVPRNQQHSDEPRPDDRALGDGTVQRAAELASAWCRPAPVAVAWVRERTGGPVRVITAGPALAAHGDHGQDVLMLPAGARGLPLPDGQAVRLLSAVPCWVELAGVCDVLLAGPGLPGSTPGGRDRRPSLEVGLLSAWLGPFGWLLLAEPVDAGTLEELTSQVALAQLEAQRNDSPRAKLAERRAAARHAELRQAASTGLWRVHLLAGAATPQQAAQVAGLLRASSDLAGLPYALLPARPAVPAKRSHERPAGRGPARAVGGPLPGEPDLRWAPDLQWAAADGRHHAAAVSSPHYQQAPAGGPASTEGRWPSPQPSAPFYASTALVAALARIPVREVPGLRVVARPQFDLTPEPVLVARAGSPGAEGARAVCLGEVLDWNRVPCGDLTLPLASLNRHVLVCGATGSGKSQTVRNLLEQATGAGIPWLVVEPAKAEYRLMAARLPGTAVIVIRPGDLDQPPAGINPLEPATGPDGSRFPLQSHADLLRGLFLAAFQADEPFPQVLSAALTRCYEQAGWDLVTGQPATPGVQPAYPGLEDLQAAATAVVSEIGYGQEVADNVRGFVAVRIGSLRMGTAGRFLDGGHLLDFAALLAGNVVLEIEDAGDDRDKAFLMGAVLIRLTEHLRLRHRADGPATASGLRHLTVIEEAHRLLRQPPPGTGSGPAAQATEMFADLLAEVRAYGEGLVIAEQIPAKLIPDAVKNTAVKITHRLPAADDRDAVGATMNLGEEQSEYLVTLPPGEAAVHADGMDNPLLARMPDGTSREATQAATAAGPDPVITRRSPTCGPDCQARPCTLGQMRAAQCAAITDPRITLWAELTVVAHLTGCETPRPAPVLAASLRAMEARQRDCAISHAVDAAIAARVPAICSRLSPAGLAAHVVATMRPVIAEGATACEPEEPRYLAAPYRWALVRDALRPAYHSPATGRHPRSAEWERVYGQPVPGDSGKAQFMTVTRWYLRDQRDSQAITAIVWGSRPRPAIEQAIGTHASNDDWADQFAEALDAFMQLPWPGHLMSREPVRIPRVPEEPGTADE